MFWDNLTQICNERGTTPTKLLRKMGYSTSKADLWKNGSLPKQEMLRELADELHCSVADFFDDEVHLFYKSEQEWAEGAAFILRLKTQYFAVVTKENRYSFDVF